MKRIALAAVVVMGLSGLFGPAPAQADVPEPGIAPPLTLSVSAASVEVGQTVTLTVLTAPSMPVAVDLVEPHGLLSFGQFTADAAGNTTATWQASRTGTFMFSVRTASTESPVTTASASFSVTPAAVVVGVQPDARTVPSETAVRVESALALRAGVPWASGVVFEYKAWGKPWRRLTAASTGADGTTRTTDRPWKRTQYRVRFPGDADTLPGESHIATVETTPIKKPVRRPRRFPEPIRKHRNPDRPPPSGRGANPQVTRITNKVFKRMHGVSWSPGCVPRSSLRYVTTNYWGFDGYRYRGEIVVHASIAKNVAGIFRDFYRIRYPIRQMRLVDDFGPSPWKGANDYRSMAADNTSAFNCRYVVGREPHVLSPHASGHSIDINPWENPYISPRGVYPNRAYLQRSVRHPALFRPNNQPRRIMSRHGCSWLGYSDTQHFDCWSSGPRYSAALGNDNYPVGLRYRPGDKYGWGME